MIKRILAAMTAIAFLIMLSVGVSAESQSLTDYGIGVGYYYTSSEQFKLTQYVTTKASSGFTITPNSTDTNHGVFLWAIPIQSDYTYTLTFSGTFTISGNSFRENWSFSPIIPNNLLYQGSLLTSGLYVSNILSNVATTVNITQNSSTNYSIVYTVVFNSTTSGLTLSTAYLYSPFYWGLADNDSVTCTMSNHKFSATYDPDGKQFQIDYSSYFNQIINAGSGYSVPDGSTLDSSVNSLNSAEGVVKDKSSSLINSVSSEMSDNLSQAKALSTTLKPAAVQINNIYNSFLSVLPSEVKAVFIAVPLLLFVGWLVGRIKE